MGWYALELTPILGHIVNLFGGAILFPVAQRAKTFKSAGSANAHQPAALRVEMARLGRLAISERGGAKK